MSAAGAVEAVAAGAFPEARAEDHGETGSADILLVDQLQNVGVNAVDIRKLKDAGLCTVGQVAQIPTRKLLMIKGLSEAKVDKIREATRKLIGDKTSFCTATELFSRRQNVIRITTGSKELDAILGGGIEAGCITELFGEARTGKTQIVHTLAVTCQLSREDGGGMGRVVVIDTEGAFRPERVAEVAEKRFGLDPGQVLDNVRVARAFTVDDMEDLLPAVATMLAEDDEPTRLVVVDSIMALFRTDYTGRGELAERQQRLNQYLMALSKIAEEFGVAVLLTNQVSANPDSTFAGADAKRPIGGHVLAHASTVRVQLRKGKGDQRIAKIFDSPSLPEAEAIFALAEGGVVDAD